MFGEKAFESWLHILVGSTLFAWLFMLVALLTELVFEGTLQVTGWVISLGTAAFVGYIGVSLLIRLDNADRS